LVRVAAAESLARIDADNQDACPALIAALWSGPPSVRRSAATVLGTFGPRFRAAVPDLITLVRNDPDINVRRMAAFALAEIVPGPDSSAPQVAAAVDALAQALRNDGVEAVRLFAALGLLRFGAASWRATPALGAALRAPEDYSGSAAVAADLLA